MSLPAAWLDSLFGRLLVRYGASLSRVYEGADMALVKADWAAVLSSFREHPEAISYALDNLPPTYPPNATEFRDICRRMPSTDLPALPLAAADPAIVAKALAALNAPVAERSGSLAQQCIANIERIHGARPQNLAVRAVHEACRRVSSNGAGSAA